MSQTVHERAAELLEGIGAGSDYNPNDYYDDPVSLVERIQEEELFDEEKGFSPPKDHIELLARGIEWAKDESRWARGSWVEKNDLYDTDDDDDDLTCTSVRACAMGILVLSTYNGPMIRAYYKSGKGFDFTAVINRDPIIQRAAHFLAAGLSTVIEARQTTSLIDSDEEFAHHMDDGLDEDDVISLNDNHAQAEDILNGFKLAYAKAQAAAA